MLELAARRERLKVRTLAELEKRTRTEDELLCRLLDEVDEERRTLALLQTQVAELKTQRRELRQAIAAEAEKHEMELVADDEGGDDALAAEANG